MNLLVTLDFESLALSIQSLEQGFTERPSCKEIKPFLGLEGQSQVSQWPEVESKTIRENTSAAPRRCYQSWLSATGPVSCRQQGRLNEDDKERNITFPFPSELLQGWLPRHHVRSPEPGNITFVLFFKT